jgi:alkylation response protein AidB-like acyl-CoA dehydrogenase
MTALLPSDAAFGHLIRQFLAANLPADIAERGKRAFRPLARDIRAWSAILHTQGWSVPNWPREYGGPGWSISQQHIFEIESLRFGAPPPSPQGLYLVGPTVYTFGSEQQKQRFLAPIREGTAFWAQGFSEPNAGSDLGSLRTLAERDGNFYVVNGQKIWTSDARESEWLFLLVRTTMPHIEGGGISFLLVDLNSPGITIRPIRSIDNATHLNELFLDNLRVPAENLLGEEGNGWRYAKFLLTLERASSAVVPQCVVGIERLEALVKRAPHLASDPLLASRIAELKIDLLAHEVSTRRVIAAEESGRSSATLVSSTLKIRGSELLQRIGALTVETLGTAVLPLYEREAIPHRLLDSRPFGADVPGIMADFIYRRAATIYGGSNEIQRNILAKALLRQ